MNILILQACIKHFLSLMEGSSVVEPRYEHLVIDSGAIIHGVRMEHLAKVLN